MLPKKTADIAEYMKNYFNQRSRSGKCHRCKEPAVIVRYYSGEQLIAERITKNCARHTQGLNKCIDKVGTV